MAAGRFDGQLLANSTDETGKLIDAMAKMQAVLNEFQSAQTEMARQHELGNIAYAMDAARLPGAYGELASANNAMVKSHMDLYFKALGLVSD